MDQGLPPTALQQENKHLTSMAASASPRHFIQMMPSPASYSSSSLRESGSLLLPTFVTAPDGVFTELPSTSGPMGASNSRPSSRPAPPRGVTTTVGIQRAVIDLTADDNDSSLVVLGTPIPQRSTRANRPPNFERDIIDVDALPDQPSPPPPRRRSSRSRSPEVQFTYSRPVAPGARPQQQQQPHPDHPRTAPLQNPLAFFHQNFSSHFHDNGAPFTHGDRHLRHNLQTTARVLVGEQPPVSARGRRAASAAAAAAAAAATAAATAAPAAATAATGRPAVLGIAVATAHAHRFQPPAFAIPDMSYDTVALNENANTVPLPAAPPPPREGFSRSPTEDEIPVCPNCGDELGAGETKEKREIMFVRACGHLYCGECVRHRGVSKRRGDLKLKGEPFKNCVVCAKPVSSRTAFKPAFI